MHETILRNGEIAFTSTGDMIMNVDTLLELRRKMKAEEGNKEEQSAEDAMENVCVLLARLFGSAILNKGEKPAQPAVPAFNPEDDKHPAPFQKYFFPTVLHDVFDKGQCKAAEENSPWLYVDNYGNIFPTMGEAEYRHQLPTGAASAIIKGRQKVGYSYGYDRAVVEEAKSLKDYRKYKDADHVSNAIYPEDRAIFNNKHLVYLVKVDKNDLLPMDEKVPQKFHTTRETRYKNWVKAMKLADATLRQNLRENSSRIIAKTPNFRPEVNNYLNDGKFLI